MVARVQNIIPEEGLECGTGPFILHFLMEKTDACELDDRRAAKESAVR